MLFMRKIDYKGFTLTEMLLVSAMLAVISLAVYATFDNGVKIWKKANAGIPEEDLCIFFERFTSDLRNGFVFEDIGFSGSETAVEFASLVKNTGSSALTIGRVAYFYEPASGLLIRRESDFSDIYEGKEGVSVPQLKNVKNLRFSYYFCNPQMKDYSWHDECRDWERCLSVRIDLELESGKGRIKFTRTVALPVTHG